MKSKMLGALALLTLIGALFVMQSADRHTPTADAAAGSIAALNVGTCLTTDDDISWYKEDETECNLSGGSGAAIWEVRDEIAEVSNLYATYAHDPKTSSDEPRAILMDSDLIKISIHDADRDKRTGVLIRGASIGNTIPVAGVGTNNTDNQYIDDDASGSLGEVISEDLGDDFDYQRGDPDLETAGTTAGEDEDIKLTHGILSETVVHIQGNVTSSIINGSGSVTLNFDRADAPNGEPFKPGDFNVEHGAIVRFYGCLDLTVGTAGTCDGEEKIVNLKDYISVDEDASNGEASGDIAPWLGVNVSIPHTGNILILAIYYRTSVVENLVGGNAYHYCDDPAHTVVDRGGDVGWKCDDPASMTDAEVMMNNDEDDVVYTSNEMDDNTALIVRATSDGDDRSTNLYLSEKSAFSGRYEGYLHLTDSNGDGSVDDDTDPANDETKSRDDWGLKSKPGTGASDSEEDVPVLGVESGPVTIEYRDSDGRMQRLRIEIDKQPPAIEITAPAHGSASGDQSPDFSGTLEDSDSGLADNSFRLVVDNEVDNEGKNEDFVLANRAPMADGVTIANKNPVITKVSHIGEYAGYSDTVATVGIAPAAELYDLGDDSCSNQDQCHILAESYSDGANRGTFDDTLRLYLRDGDDDADIRDAEFEIDFQAFVMDMAGNIGFSDSDPANPRFINDLGEADVDKRKPGNVLGYYSAHIITLDEKDPVIDEDQTATGYYGLDSDGKPTIQDRSSVMVVFDGPITASSVSNSTFSVKLDDGSSASVIDHEVAKNYVFLMLASELASDATPMIDIANGEKVEDMAGNETFGREVDEFEVADGISPRLTVTLSGGTGTGTGNEGPEKLTRDRITVHVSSDEMLQSAPRIVVTCSSLRWNEGADANVKKDIDDYIANRNTASTGKPGETPARTPAVAKKNESYTYTCGYENDAGLVQGFTSPTEVSSLSRPGDNWEYTWQNNGSSGLQDGSLTAVAFGRDRSRYEGSDDKMLENWGSASAEFTLDTKVVYPDPARDVSKGGDLQPAPDGTSKESRPFVLIEFNEGTTVTLASVELDGVEVASKFEMPDHNRFVYWPQSLSQGDHEVEVEATDAAGNEAAFSYDFETVARGDFVIGLNAGWNAISVPADPVDTAIGSVFSDPAITTVTGWDTQGWRIAIRRDGVWESNEKYGALNEIRARYGYWVKSNGFVRQPVALKGGTSRDVESSRPTLIKIPTEPGWNFVGVVDQDSDQTESDDFGNDLMGSDDRQIPASEYLGSNYVRAYTWDATFSRFDVVRPNHAMTIGDGVWVYYPEGTGIAP